MSVNERWDENEDETRGSKEDLGQTSTFLQLQGSEKPT